MNAIRIRKQIDSETIHLPDLRGLIGKTVEIIVLDESPSSAEPLETTATFWGLRPQGREVTPSERQAELAQLRVLARTDPKLAAFLEAAAADCLDVDAVIDQRAKE